jgi:hypothetical protein
MTLSSTAQLFVVDPSMVQQMGEGAMSFAPLEVSEKDGEEHSEEVPHKHLHDQEELEVAEPGEVAIVIGELPGAPSGTVDPEPPIEVSEMEEEKKDEQDAEPKKNEKWDWSSRGAHGFIAWIKERCDDVPKHSGSDSAGLERAVAYLDRLDGEISRAMRMDLDGELDANQIEKVRATIEEGVERLNDRLDKVKKVKKTKRSKKKSELDTDSVIVKEAQKIMGVGGVIVTADLLTSHIARICVNSTVSAGHDIEVTLAEQIKKYSLNKREQACLIELLDCMGYPMRRDRGYLLDEEHNDADGKFDWISNFRS